MYIQMRQILLDNRRNDLPRLFILRHANFLSRSGIRFVGEGVDGINLAGVFVGYGDSSLFGGSACAGARAVWLGPGVGHHDCFVEIVVEIFMLFLRSAGKMRNGVDLRHVTFKSGVESKF